MFFAKGSVTQVALLIRFHGSWNDNKFLREPISALIHHRRPNLYYPPLQNVRAAVMENLSFSPSYRFISRELSRGLFHLFDAFFNDEQFPYLGVLITLLSMMKIKGLFKRPFLCFGAGGRIRTDTESNSAGF